MRVPELNAKVEIVRGRMTDERATQILRFWAGSGALEEAEARRRLAEVVCVLLDGTGEVIGVNSVYADTIPMLGGRELWVYRSLLAEGAEAARYPMMHVAHNALTAEFDPSVAGPIGLVLLVDDRDEMARNPGAAWLYPPFIYAGYLPSGPQLRVWYFMGATITRPRPIFPFPLTIDRRYRLDVFDEQDAVDGKAIVDLWLREGVITPQEAERRVGEVLVVGRPVDGGTPAAVATAYLAHSPQLRMDLWHVRVFVAREHRASGVAMALCVVARDRLQQRFVGGQDTRGPGLLFEVENEGLKRFDDVTWYPMEITFVGENARGDHLRVRYFAGAPAPPPPDAAS